MARFIHWTGVAFLLIAAVLLLITTISAPVIGDIAILKVTLTNASDLRHSSVTFGTFGHCVLDVAPPQTDQDFCYPAQLGYAPAQIMAQIDGVSTFSTAAANSADGLTAAMILHPVAFGLAVIAFLFSLRNSIFGSLFAAMIASVAWVLTLVVMAIDFAVFGTIKSHVNNDGSGSHAFYSVGMWTCLAAMLLLFFGSIIVLATCFSTRRRGGGQPSRKRSSGGGGGGGGRRRSTKIAATEEVREVRRSVGGADFPPPPPPLPPADAMFAADPAADPPHPRRKKSHRKKIPR